MQFYFLRMEHFNHRISGYCKIKNNKIIRNDRLIYEDDPTTDFPTFISALYKRKVPSYSKFYKMDFLSKLGFITAELLLQDTNYVSMLKGTDIAIVISNAQSSLETDATFQKTIADKNNYYPNPSLFVYTLPNIMIGEICIKNKIMGESTFFISEKPDSNFLCQYVDDLLNKNAAKLVITGWVDLDLNCLYESMLCLVEKSPPTPVPFPVKYAFNPKNMDKLFDFSYD